jgi:hypothetical protein
VRPANLQSASASHLDRESRIFQPIHTNVGGQVTSGSNYEALYQYGEYGAAWRNQPLFQGSASFAASSPSGTKLTISIPNLLPPQGLTDTTLDLPKDVWFTILNPLTVSVTVVVLQTYTINGTPYTSNMSTTYTVNAGEGSSQIVTGLLMGDALPQFQVTLGGSITSAGDVYVDLRWV